LQQKYESFGGPSVLGFPIAHDGATADGTGALVRLQGGVIYWSQRTGAHVVRGAILDMWRQLGAQTGPMGYPTGDDVAVPGGYKTVFQNGAIYWSAATGARGVRGALQQKYESFGGPSVLGFPIAHDGATADGTGALVRLQGGVIYWSPSTGAHAVRGGILTHWLADGGPAGSLGFPVTDHVALPDGGGWQVRFQNGTLTERPDGTIETTTG
ncbi:LGFP repeat-containing protein, partial [Geodermatophilus sp. SYSU D00779]